MKRLALVAAATALSAAMTPAFAQQGLRPGFYVLGGVGQAEMSVNQGELDGASLTAGNGAPSSVNNTETGWKLGAGYQINQYFAVEGTYVDFGKPSYSNPAPGPYVGVNLHPTSWNLYGVGTVPVAQNFGLFGKIGAAFTSLKADTAELTSYSNSTTKTNLAWGVGAEYNFTRNFALRGEYEDFGNVGETPNFIANTGTATGRLSLWSLSALYRF